MAHGGGREAIGKKPDRFSKAILRVGRTYAQGIKSAVPEKKWPTKYGETPLQVALIKHGKAKPVAFRNTSLDITKLR